jgi:acyl transferase domain-containing protein
MTQEGLPVQEMWETLETLNLGRLRIASKGLVREGDRIVTVDEAMQHEQGMVMLGEVAALRSQPTTIADLHKDVSNGATRVLESLDTRPHEREASNRDVAIVGMAAIMPKAPELADFWSNIVKGVDCITEVPPERWNAGIFYDPASKDGEKTPSKWGGFIDAVAFDPLQYGIPPLTLAAIEPVQLLSLEVSRRALDDAGYVERSFDRERTSVIFGAEAGSDLSSAYGFRTLWRQYVGDIPPELEAVLPTMTEDSFAGILSNVISGRIANRLDLGGVNFTVDAACAASLAAVNLAMGELAAGTSDMVICGGADLHNGIVDYLAFSSTHALGNSGKCRTFDASADGIALGEGVAAVVLKRLADAERDGDRIYAVVKAVGGASDGKSLGLTAPRAQGQVRTLDRAYRQAGVAFGDVDLVEAHGTGTVVGDRTELESLNLVFSRGGPEAGSITLGSVKSQIGHTKCTAGIAGLIKVSLSLHNRVLPATLNLENPNPGWDASSPFSLNTAPRPWPGSKRKAGVSAFGFGGTNFHAVVEEYEGGGTGHGYDVWPSELFLFRGDDTSTALDRISELTRLLDRDEAWRLRDLASSTSAGSEPVRIAVVANDLDDLRVKLAKAAAQEADPSGVFIATHAFGPEAKVAFLYPGQGSQSAGMLRDLFIAFPDLQRYLELDPTIAKLTFPPTAWDDATREAQRTAITDTRAAQPALVISAIGLSYVV